MIATSVQRVRRRTAASVDEEIRRRTEMRLAYYAAHPDGIDGRLRELDGEWDLERALETATGVLSLSGFVMGVLGRRRWLLLPLAVQAFFLRHAVRGSCPPPGVLRRLGFRTPAEIEAERYALKALKGDFKGVSEARDLDALARAERALRAVSNGRAGAGREPEAPLFEPPPEPRAEGPNPPAGAGPAA